MYPNSEFWNNEYQVKLENSTTQASCKNCKRLKTRMRKLEQANRILAHQAGERYVGQRLGYDKDKSLSCFPELATWPPRLDGTHPFTPDSFLNDPPRNSFQNEPMPNGNEHQMLQNMHNTPFNFPLKIEPQPHNMTTEYPINIYPNDSPIMNPPLWSSPLHLTTETPFSVTSDLSDQNMFIKFDSMFDGLNWDQPNLTPWDPMDQTVESPFNFDYLLETPDSLPSKTTDATTQTPGMCFCRIHFYET